MPRGLIFDLDGTLVDSLPGIAVALNRALEEAGHPAHSEEQVRGFIGDGTWMLARRGLPAGVPDPDVEAVEAAVLRHYAACWREGTRVYDGIPEVLGMLMEEELPLAIFSNKAHDFTVEITAALFAGVPFVEVLGQRAGTPRKPDPAGALHIAARMGLDPGEVAFVGDSTVDYETAANAGMQPLLVTWGYHPREALERTSAPLLEDPRHLLRYPRGPRRDA